MMPQVFWKYFVKYLIDHVSDWAPWYNFCHIHSAELTNFSQSYFHWAGETKCQEPSPKMNLRNRSHLSYWGPWFCIREYLADSIPLHLSMYRLSCLSICANRWQYSKLTLTHPTSPTNQEYPSTMYQSYLLIVKCCHLLRSTLWYNDRKTNCRLESFLDWGIPRKEVTLSHDKFDCSAT